MRRLGEDIRRSPRVRALLANRDDVRVGVYAKWQGAHWILGALADLGYPAGDETLTPLRDRVLDTWLHDNYFREFEAQDKAGSYHRKGVPVMQGRVRRCASQQGYALLFLTELGIADERTATLAERLLHWQWPDGGWNCDREPATTMSSVHETLLPMRGLAAHAGATGTGEAGLAARRAAEVFLQRRLYKRRTDGQVFDREVARFHFPRYWHYDVLAGLRGMTDVGLIHDERCADALDLLESKQLGDGGWPAERRYYRRVSPDIGLHSDYVDWGGASVRRRNDWVTTEALAVLRAAGRISV